MVDPPLDLTLGALNGTLLHQHGPWSHEHHYVGPHRHPALVFRSTTHVKHEHSHGHVDRSILRSRAGVQAVAISLAVLAGTALLQALIFAVSGSVALFADLIHNGGDALTAVPLGFAFVVRSERAERWSGKAVVAAILISALVAAYESVRRLFHPQHLDYLLPLAVAGALGFVGNELAARVRLHAGHRLDSPALLADGAHAHADGFVSLGVVASAVVVALGVRVADPLIGLAITAVILKVTFDAWRTVTDDHSH